MPPRFSVIISTFLCVGILSHAAESRSLKEIVQAVPKVELPEMIAALQADIFASLPKDSYRQGRAFSDLANAWMRVNVPERLASKSVFPAAAEPLPKMPDNHPPELREAVERFWQVDGPYFRVLLPTPPANDAVIPVSLTTESFRLKLRLPRPEDAWKGQTMEIVLWGQQTPEQQNVGFWGPARFSLPVADEVAFAQLQPGPCRMEIVVRADSPMKINLGEVRLKERQ